MLAKMCLSFGRLLLIPEYDDGEALGGAHLCKGTWYGMQHARVLMHTCP